MVATVSSISPANGDEFAIDEKGLEELRNVIRTTAKNFLRFPDFVEQLSEQQVQFACHLTRNGRISSISYIAPSGITVKASSLGDEFTWTGLQRKLGVEYVKIRDFELLASYEQETTSTMAKRALANNDTVLLHRIDQLESLEKQILSKLDEQSDKDAVVLLPDASEDLHRVDEAVNKLEEIASALAESKKVESSRSKVAEPANLEADIYSHLAQIRAICQRSLVESNKSVQRMEAAATKMRQEAFWLAVVAALIVGLFSSLLTGMWLTQETEKSLEANHQAVIEHLEKREAEDPLRSYFQKLMDEIP